MLPIFGKTTGKKKFTGKLAKPVVIEPPPEAPSYALESLLPKEYEELKLEHEKKVDEWRQKSVVQMATIMKRLPLLLEHYQIPQDSPERWFWLSLYLATDFVPGLTMMKPDKKGRPKGSNKQWPFDRQLELYQAVTEKMEQRENEACTIDQICRDLKRKEPWKTMKVSGRELSSKRLANMYHEVCHDHPVAKIIDQIVKVSPEYSKPQLAAEILSVIKSKNFQ